MRLSLILVLALIVPGCNGKARTGTAVVGETAPTPPGTVVPTPLQIVQTDPVAFGFVIFYPPTARGDAEAAMVAAIERSLPGFGRAREADDGSVAPRYMVTASEPPWRPDAEELKHFGVGLSPDDVASLQAATRVLSAQFELPASDAPARRAAILRLVSEVAGSTGGLIWDGVTRQFFSRQAAAERAANASEAAPAITSLITLHMYQTGTGDGVRIVTLGMGALGLPDLAVTNVPYSFGGRMAMLVNVACQTMFERKQLTGPGSLELNIAALSSKRFKDSLRVHDGAKPVTTIKLASAEPMEGDPENRILQLEFPGEDGTLAQRQDAMLTSLGGKLDEVFNADSSDAELSAATARAKRELATLRPSVKLAPAGDDHLLVKAPFTTDDDSVEWMWVEVTTWNGTTFTGILMNEPRFVSGLKQGADVTVEQADIFDFSLRRVDGSVFGGETNEILQRQRR